MTDRDSTKLAFVRSALALCASAFCGCAAQGLRAEAPLPFHVALIPFSAEQVRGSAESPGSADETFRLSIDSATASRSVASTLASDCFVRATLLRYPEGVAAEDFDRWTTADRDAYWVKASEAAGADLILECSLRYSPELRVRNNEKFWMNLPLFLLGGPACYFVDDISYRGEARLDGNLFDLSAIRTDHATLEDRRAQVLHLESRFEEASLDFVDRSGGNVGLYAVSILVPAGLLSHESEGARKKLAGKVADHLALGFARAVRDGESEILVADRLTGFHLDPRYTVEVHGDHVSFHGEAVLRRAEQERMETWSIRLGAHTTSGEFGAGVPDRENSTRHTQFLRFSFQADVPADASADCLTVELAAGGANPGVRTFTVPLKRNEKSEEASEKASLAARP